MCVCVCVCAHYSQGPGPYCGDYPGIPGCQVPMCCWAGMQGMVQGHFWRQFVEETYWTKSTYRQSVERPLRTKIMVCVHVLQTLQILICNISFILFFPLFLAFFSVWAAFVDVVCHASLFTFMYIYAFCVLNLFYCMDSLIFPLTVIQCKHQGLFRSVISIYDNNDNNNHENNNEQVY